MKHRLKTTAGKAIYAQRKVTSEPVFGIIKAVMGFRSFLLRGFESVNGEWNLVCMAYNIKRPPTCYRDDLWRQQGRQQLGLANVPWS